MNYANIHKTIANYTKTKYKLYKHYTKLQNIL